MSTKQVINKELFESSKIQSFKKEFETAQPFQYLRIQSFLNKEFIPKLEKSLNENSIEFNKKDNDLYRFFQSYGLEQLPQKTAIQDLIKSLYSQEFRQLLFKITGKHVNDKPDLFASCYTDTSYLLCHDDQIEDRSIAFILYLVPSDWNENDGGALNIYDSYNANSSNNNNDDNGQQKINVNIFPKHKPYKQLIPERNSVVLFQVSDKSFHAVDEVLTDNKKRIAIGGWWHAMDEDNMIHNLNKSKVAKPDPIIIWNEPNNKLSLLKKWLNPVYLKDDAIKQLQTKFLEDSHVIMMDFLNEELYYKLLNQLFSVKCMDNDYDYDNIDDNQSGISWKLRGPIHRRLYYKLSNMNNDNSNEHGLILEFNQLIESIEWKQLIQKIVSLKIMKYNVEIRRFDHGHYTIAHDLDRFKDLPGLDVNFQFIENEANGWNPQKFGGSTYYTLGKQDSDDDNDDSNDIDDNDNDKDKDDNVVLESIVNEDQVIINQSEDEDEDEDQVEEELDDEEMDDGILMSVHSFPNTLSVTYRSSQGVMSFVKYLNHLAPCSKADINQIWTVDDNDDSDNDQDDDINKIGSELNEKKRKLQDLECDQEPPSKKQKM